MYEFYDWRKSTTRTIDCNKRRKYIENLKSFVKTIRYLLLFNVHPLGLVFSFFRGLSPWENFSVFSPYFYYLILSFSIIWISNICTKPYSTYIVTLSPIAPYRIYLSISMFAHFLQTRLI